jgi:hypothetical protein
MRADEPYVTKIEDEIESKATKDSGFAVAYALLCLRDSIILVSNELTRYWSQNTQR